MTVWRLKIDTVGPLIGGYEEGDDVSLLAEQVAGALREAVRKARRPARGPGRLGVLEARDVLGLDVLLDELSAAETEDEFDSVLSAVYDWADYVGVWIEPPPL
jgi:hypothetical protein